MSRAAKSMTVRKEVSNHGGTIAKEDGKAYSILLGTLKKIESKTTSLTAIAIFVAISLITALPLLEDLCIINGLTVGLICFLVLMTGILIGGTHHVDQAAANARIIEAGNDEVKYRQALRDDLAADLLRKESEFESCALMLGVSTIIAVLIFLLYSFTLR